ncbi:MAG: peptidylprolyl isomerase [Verrucomicrobiota bacterium]
MAPTPRSLPRAAARRARFPWRAVIYGVVILYLFVDLYWVAGPLRGQLERWRSPQDSVEAGPVAALLYGEPLTLTTLDQAVVRYLWKRGRSVEGLSPRMRRELRLAVLRELVIDRALEVRAKYQDQEIDEAVLEEEWQAFLARFPSPGQRRAELESWGVEDADAREALRQRLLKERWLEQAILPDLEVASEEIEAWFAENREDLRLPERIRARHIFLPSLRQDQAALREQAQALHEALVEDQSRFSELAKEQSRDPATAPKGGDLGWFAADRMDASFTGPVFRHGGLGLLAPFESKIGWHVVEILNRAPGRPATLAEMEKEIRLHLRNEKRRVALQELEEQLFATAKVEIRWDVFQN